MANGIFIESTNQIDLLSAVSESVKKELKAFKEELQNQKAIEELMTRSQVLDFLQINASTLWHWQNSKKIIVYKFANKNYYKRSEILEGLKPLKK